MKNKKVAMAGVSLSEACALSENHSLSKALSPLSELGESGGESAKHSLTLSAPSSLSGKSLTRAQHENGTKRAFEDRKPLKAEVGEKQGYA